MGRRWEKGEKRGRETDGDRDRNKQREKEREKQEEKIQQAKRFTLQKNGVVSEKKKLALDKNQMTWVSGFYIPDILL